MVTQAENSFASTEKISFLLLAHTICNITGHLLLHHVVRGEMFQAAFFISRDLNHDEV